MVKKAVILCGGLATRFLPISKSIPKEMLPLLDKPVMQVIVENIVKAGITDILMIIGRNKECVVKHFDRNVELEENLVKNKKFDLLKQVEEPSKLANIFYKHAYNPTGTASALNYAKEWVNGEPFVMMFGDEIVLCEKENVVEQILKVYNKYKKNVIAVKKIDISESFKYGMIVPKKIENKTYEVLDIIEKPKVEDSPSDISSIGPAVLTSEIFEEIDKLKIIEGKEAVLTDAYKFLCLKNKMIAVEIDGEREDMGNKFGFIKANIDACLKDSTYREQLKDYLKMLMKKIG